ncbi:Uncharacterised protein [Budvicia aquatica]|uniref:Uncharacterized protein n=1 Tax=Budvicia aquatica TaxID=82979 RepID=A0A484ZHV4_9GAMM|nr:Uncharacterised protein [Budvicia aquatica]
MNLRVGANGLLSDVKFMFTPTAGLWPENAYIAVVYADVSNFGIFGGHRRSNTIMNENSYVTTDVGDFNIEPYDSFYHYDMALVIKSDGPINFSRVIMI